MKTGELVDERYEIESLAGEGGMAAVYRARDRITGDPVAIKVLHDHRTRQSRRFEREARVLCGLRHPGIVRYIGHGVISGKRAYLAMSWLDGETLSARLAREELTVGE